MIILSTNFAVNTGATVKDGYSWDQGTPIVTKPLTPIKDYIVGTAPYTKVVFDVNATVLATSYKLTKFAFDFNDYYNETKSLTAFLPRPPRYPSEDKYNFFWEWSKMTQDEFPNRRSLTTGEYLSGGVFLPALSAGRAFNIFRTSLSANVTNLSLLQQTPIYIERLASTSTTAPDLILSNIFKGGAASLSLTDTIKNTFSGFYHDLPLYYDLEQNYYDPSPDGINNFIQYNLYPNCFGTIRQDSQFYFKNNVYSGSYFLNLTWDIDNHSPGLQPGLSAFQTMTARETPDRRSRTHYVEYTTSQTIPNYSWCTASILVKPDRRNRVRLSLDTATPLNPNPVYTPTVHFAEFDLANGVATKVGSGIPSGNRYCIVRVGNGWWYISITCPPQATGDYAKLRLTLLDDNGNDTYTSNNVLEAPPGVYLYGNEFIQNKDVNFFTPGLGAGNYTNQCWRIYGYFLPQETDYYYFWIRSNTDATLLLADVDKERDVQVSPGIYQICSNIIYGPGATQTNPKRPETYAGVMDPANNTAWDINTSQASSPQLLQAGRPYYFELRLWSGDTGLYTDIGWSKYSSSTPKIKWYQAAQLGQLPKLWNREGYVASGQTSHIYTMPGVYAPSLKVTLDPSLTSTYIYDDTEAKFNAVELIDKPPAAGFVALSSTFGYSPITIEFSPITTNAGTLPLERIDWDFGDGSPIVTVTRHTTTSASPNVYFRKNFVGDLSDPRNYHVVHTYTRNTPSDPTMFYPTITAYSANTLTHSIVSREVGPIGNRKQSKREILKTNFYDADNKGYFVLNADGKTVLLRQNKNYTRKSIQQSPLSSIKVPSNILYINDFGTNYFGNTGIDMDNLLNNT